jgi:hypothetical protein
MVVDVKSQDMVVKHGYRFYYSSPASMIAAFELRKSVSGYLKNRQTSSHPGILVSASLVNAKIIVISSVKVLLRVVVVIVDV